MRSSQLPLRNASFTELCADCLREEGATEEEIDNDVSMMRSQRAYCAMQLAKEQIESVCRGGLRCECVLSQRKWRQMT